MADESSKPDPEIEAIKAILRDLVEQREADRAEDKRKREADRAEDKRKREADRAEDKQRRAEDKRKRDKERAEDRQRSARVDRQLEETSQSIKSLREHVGGQEDRWGKIVESLVAGSIGELLTEALGIRIYCAGTRFAGTNVKTNKNWEIDVLAMNTDVVVPVEVKTTLRKKHIDRFITRILDQFTHLMPRFADCYVFGAIAYVRVDGNEDSVIDYALSKGLIVIKTMKGTNSILNPKGQQLHDFRA